MYQVLGDSDDELVRSSFGAPILMLQSSLRG